MDIFALARRRSFIAAVTTTRLDERRIKIFGGAGAAGFFGFKVPLIFSLCQ